MTVKLKLLLGTPCLCLDGLAVLVTSTQWCWWRWMVSPMRSREHVLVALTWWGRKHWFRMPLRRGFLYPIGKISFKSPTWPYLKKWHHCRMLTSNKAYPPRVWWCTCWALANTTREATTATTQPWKCSTFARRDGPPPPCLSTGGKAKLQRFSNSLGQIPQVNRCTTMSLKSSDLHISLEASPQSGHLMARLRRTFKKLTGDQRSTRRSRSLSWSLVAMRFQALRFRRSCDTKISGPIAIMFTNWKIKLLSRSTVGCSLLRRWWLKNEGFIKAWHSLPMGRASTLLLTSDLQISMEIQKWWGIMSHIGHAACLCAVWLQESLSMQGGFFLMFQVTLWAAEQRLNGLRRCRNSIETNQKGTTTAGFGMIGRSLSETLRGILITWLSTPAMGLPWTHMRILWWHRSGRYLARHSNAWSHWWGFRRPRRNYSDSICISSPPLQSEGVHSLQMHLRRSRNIFRTISYILLLYLLLTIWCICGSDQSREFQPLFGFCLDFSTGATQRAVRLGLRPSAERVLEAKLGCPASTEADLTPETTKHSLYDCMTHS